MFHDEDDFLYGHLLGHREVRVYKILPQEHPGCECVMVVSLRVQLGSQVGVCAALGVCESIVHI